MMFDKVFYHIPEYIQPYYNPEKPWELLNRIENIILEYAAAHKSELAELPGKVFVGKGARIEPGSAIQGPALISPGCDIRHGAYIRGNVIAGGGCVIGNSTEVKNAILFDHVQAPHFNYIGDSVLGYEAHLGAGVILSNALLIRDKEHRERNANGKPALKRIDIRMADGARIETGLTKFGALVGDYAEIGCNSVLNPGTVLEKGLFVPPLRSIGGYVGNGFVFGKENISKRRLSNG